MVMCAVRGCDRPPAAVEHWQPERGLIIGVPLCEEHSTVGRCFPMRHAAALTLRTEQAEQLRLGAEVS